MLAAVRRVCCSVNGTVLCCAALCVGPGHRFLDCYCALLCFRVGALFLPSIFLFSTVGLVVGGVQVTTAPLVSTAGWFASGKYEVIAKVPDAPGMTWAVWTYHYEVHLPKYGSRRD